MGPQLRFYLYRNIVSGSFTIPHTPSYRPFSLRAAPSGAIPIAQCGSAAALGFPGRG